ncbi:hypothetical protein SAMN05216207_1006108 [Pseudonocardia ammonioxydans]|uniref:ODP domain-containing protein n=1 Tax=Pseudonocardia ammonioxydans TaxID=260086 RepID=A0A1I4VJG9_PSUAM|nr:MBL fold metallo-hydrolase [Pseudonocardia ammonioxydans]SFN01250.1 hypothetical protein SAMN05216207_1006108 [Pseudonocardia ammonioxydans]
MDTVVDEVAPDIFRLSTYLPAVDLQFNQFLVRAEEPLLFHTGYRLLFPTIRDALARVIDPLALRWISFGHVEADECGAMNEWLSVAPSAQVVHGRLGVMVSLGDLADRPPRALAEGEVLDLGRRRVRWIDTAHVPHGWDSGLLLEETTGTLLCGDLFTATGPGPAVSGADPVGPALAAEDRFGATALTPGTGPTIRALAATAPTTLALMHGPAHTGDAVDALGALADAYDARLRAALDRAPA